MKQLLLKLIIITMIMVTPVQAVEIDLSSLTMEQLIELRDEINAIIAENGGQNVIGQGTYEAGVDIEAGYYEIVCSKDAQYGFINVETYPSKEDKENNVKREVSQIYFNDEEPASSECATIKLEVGNILRLSGEAIIQEIKPVWGLGIE